jgi:flagellar protein FlgJ
MLVRQLQQGVGEAGASAPSAPAANRQPLTASKDDFISKLRPHAEAAARELGVDPNALLAQAALETGWGRSVPCNANGECSFNLFGIKAGSQWSGATVNVPTLEFEEGVAVRKVERFRAYDSPADSFRDYAALIRDSSRYANARGAGDNVEAFATALQQGGYATDPHYAQKIAAVASEVRARTDALKFAAGGPSTTNRVNNDG